MGIRIIPLNLSESIFVWLKLCQHYRIGETNNNLYSLKVRGNTILCNHIAQTMDIPICSSCGYADIEAHVCIGRARRTGGKIVCDSEWKEVLKTRRRVAESQYRAYLEELVQKETERQMADWLEEQIRVVEEKLAKEIKELSRQRSFLERIISDFSACVDFAKMTQRNFTADKSDINHKIADIESKFSLIQHEISKQDVWVSIRDIKKTNRTSPEKENIVKILSDLEEEYDKSEDTILEIINDLKSSVGFNPDHCTCEKYPAMHCRVHPARDYRKEFEGRDGTIGMYDHGN